MSFPHVSRETEDRLRIYLDLLLKWQKAVNLVSPATLNNAWNRHFLDSIQLQNFIPDAVKSIVDLGSGAGFPGMVLSILRPDLNVTLIESDSKKCSFLKAVSRETGAQAAIVNQRIESVAPFVTDLVTARALTSLQDLLHFSLPYAQIHPGLVLMFPKGKRLNGEIEDAQRHFVYKSEIYPSQTDPDGQIIKIWGLARKKEA